MRSGVKLSAAGSATGAMAGCHANAANPPSPRNPSATTAMSSLMNFVDFLNTMTSDGSRYLLLVRRVRPLGQNCANDAKPMQRDSRSTLKDHPRLVHRD